MTPSIPSHIGIIMDGNRRWAKERGLSVEKGHEEGAQRVEPLVDYAAKQGISYLTLYSFSTENWNRDPLEVKLLMHVFRTMLNDPVVDRLQENGVRVNIIGDYMKFPEDIVQKIEKIHEESSVNDRITVNFALNYGGREEILNATRFLMDHPMSELTPKIFSEHLYTNEQPDPEMIIRTGGQQRLSGFLMWQSQYSELYFTDTLWPEFHSSEFQKALDWYQEQERRFGR
jgi:undecaprenyl diphosphate synthase